MTKSETQIAQENIDRMNSYKGDDELYARNIIKCGEHKQTLQRFLEFLEIPAYCVAGARCCKRECEIKLKDLKQAIKLYDEAGI